MVSVVLDPDCEAMLSQMAADIDLTPAQTARVLLESALILRLGD